MTAKPVTTKPKAAAFAAIHSAAKGLHRAGAINKTTMREYDALCLDAIPQFNAKDIKRIREHAHVTIELLLTDPLFRAFCFAQ